MCVNTWMYLQDNDYGDGIPPPANVFRVHDNNNNNTWYIIASLVPSRSPSARAIRVHVCATTGHFSVWMQYCIVATAQLKTRTRSRISQCATIAITNSRVTRSPYAFNYIGKGYCFRVVSARRRDLITAASVASSTCPTRPPMICSK